MANKFNAVDFQSTQSNLEEFLSTLTINNQKVSWELLGEDKDGAKVGYHETIVTIVGDIVTCSGNFRGTLKGYNAETGGCNIEVVETLSPPPSKINVDTTDIETNDASLEPEYEYYLERECENCGTPGGVVSVNKESFHGRSGEPRKDFTNHNDWEHNVDLTKNNWIKTSYFCCSDCRSYEL